MKMFFTVLGVLALVSGFNAQAQNKDLSVWIDSGTGTLIGGGYVSSYLTKIHAKTMAAEAPALRHAIESLDSLGMVSLKGFGLVPAAVPWQADVPIRELGVQQAETGLSYGELLLVNLIAAESKQSFESTVSMRKENRTWGEVMEKLQVDPEPIMGKAKFASDRIQDAAARRRRSRGLALNDTFPGKGFH